MKRPILSEPDRRLFIAEAKNFRDWITSMLAFTLQTYGAKSRHYRQTLRLLRIMAEWQATLIQPLSATPGSMCPTLHVSGCSPDIKENENENIRTH